MNWIQEGGGHQTKMNKRLERLARTEANHAVGFYQQQSVGSRSSRMPANRTPVCPRLIGIQVRAIRLSIL